MKWVSYKELYTTVNLQPQWIRVGTD